MIIASSNTSQKRIPTALGLVLVLCLIVAVAVTTQAAQKVTSLFSKASEVSNLGTVGVANTTDTSFSVYWTTDVQDDGAVYYGQTPALEIGVAMDDRDLTNPDGKYLTHLVRLTNLKPQTKYYFKVGATQSTATGDPNNNSAPYTATTGQTLTNTPTTTPAYGQVLDAASSPASDVLVLWTVPGATSIAALSKSDGNYVLPVANAQKIDLSGYFQMTATDSETISLDKGSQGQATITCKPSLDHPLPTVKLGDTVDCLKGTGSNSAATNGNSNQSPGFKPPSNSGSTTSTGGDIQVNITNGQIVNSPLPTISGKAGPNQTIKIEIHSVTVYSGSVQAAADGSWSWTPPANLAPGQHTVTITIVNPNGTTQVVQRTFTVSSGTPILPITSGTPSATLTHYACVNNACVQVDGAGSDSCAVDADCQPVTPTPSATPPATPATPPSTGATENTLLLLTMGAAFVILSVVINKKFKTNFYAFSLPTLALVVPLLRSQLLVVIPVVGLVLVALFLLIKKFAGKKEAPVVHIQNPPTAQDSNPATTSPTPTMGANIAPQIVPTQQPYLSIRNASTLFMVGGLLVLGLGLGVGVLLIKGPAGQQNVGSKAASSSSNSGSCDQGPGWTIPPVTPADGATNISLDPNTALTWNWEHPNAVPQAGFYINGYIYDGDMAGCSPESVPGGTDLPDKCKVGYWNDHTSNKVFTTATIDAFCTVTDPTGTGVDCVNRLRLQCGKKYYWQVYYGDSCINVMVPNYVWSFSTVPCQQQTVAACQKVTADKDLTKINIGDTITFTGQGTVSSTSDSIDLIEFIIASQSGTVVASDTKVAPTLDSASTPTNQIYDATQKFVVPTADSYTVQIKVHQKSAAANVWLQ